MTRYQHPASRPSVMSGYNHRPTALTCTFFAAALSSMFFGFQVAYGCTNIVVTHGASQDGSAMLAYNMDDQALFGSLYHYPARNHTGKAKGQVHHASKHDEDSGDNKGQKMRKIYDWDSSKYLGEIPEPDVTHNVVSNCNEHGLCIGESTFDGVDELGEQPGAIMDYGSLIWTTLQRSTTAREAIRTMTKLMETYGYASQGETFSMIDAKEAWIMDVIGKGKYEKGAVWVAQRVPDGKVVAIANYAFARTFPRDDPDNCLYAPDVVDFARRVGLYNRSKRYDEDFDFQAVYEPEPAMNVRNTMTRIWSVYSVWSADPNFAGDYLQYALGRDDSNPMPAWIKPQRKLTLNDVRERMNSHYESTLLAYGHDVEGGVYSVPYPIEELWHYNHKLYAGERNVAVERTGINFIAQVRPKLPSHLRAVVWFAVDDSSTAPRIPVYASSTRVSEAYKGKGQQHGATLPVMKFDMDRAFWVQNMVSNLVYSRWRDAYPYLRKKLDDLQEELEKEVRDMDKQAMQLHKTKTAVGQQQEPDAADADVVEALTKFSVRMGDEMQRRWTDMYGHLFARYRDFVVMEEDADDQGCGCKTVEVGYDEEWKERIVAETGDHFVVPDPDEKVDDVDEGLKDKQQHHAGRGKGDNRKNTRRYMKALGVIAALCACGFIGYATYRMGHTGGGRSDVNTRVSYSPSGARYQRLSPDEVEHGSNRIALPRVGPNGPSSDNGEEELSVRWQSNI